MSEYLGSRCAHPGVAFCRKALGIVADWGRTWGRMVTNLGFLQAVRPVAELVGVD
jgi:hypothetical protein